MTIFELKESARRKFSDDFLKKKAILEAIVVDNLKRGHDRTLFFSSYYDTEERAKNQQNLTIYDRLHHLYRYRWFTVSEIEQIAKDLEIDISIEIVKNSRPSSIKFLQFDESDRYRKVVTLSHGAL